MELITAPPNNAPRIEEVESLGAIPLFHLYADFASMTADARQRGLEILQVNLFGEAAILGTMQVIHTTSRLYTISDFKVHTMNRSCSFKQGSR